MSDFWEPWRPEIGQRVRVRLSAECEAQTYEARPAPSVQDDQLRAMMRDGVDVANRFATDNWSKGHPEQVDGVEGVVTDIRRELEFGHYYRIMFDHTVEPGAYIGLDLAAVELEPVDA